jgi:hypothetical protein
MNASNIDTKNFKKNCFQKTEQKSHNERKFIKKSSTTNEKKFESRIKRNIRAIFI